MQVPFTNSDESKSGVNTRDVAKSAMDVAELRAVIETMEERERRLMELLKAPSPDYLEHKLRNVLNELGILKSLFRSSSGN
jgi:DNA-directed RNA polymerase specialized sigma subunit